MWVTMKNTARWQISSSVLHGFVGSLQQAYGYTKNLDESLNNIRIVSGASADEMARFAEQANKAAKALNTTTVEYTDAALIYYQQGLQEEQIKERTDITVKMANVTRDSVEEVSNQLTAVWNNFDDGTKSLEYYADVMAALGAETASSTDEIAGGLEKFASIADMIGLSFEYAASALATITATTRQSEDVVGTALKTIFARIQGLKLGETLEDGTDLNKYSEALQSVGISIFDQVGQLKDMDTILGEMGAKWETLSKDQQVALAQTVAGVRQYNQLVSLMDNWDFFQENLQTSYGSAGTLDEQADIYAESWEAARDRVKAASEDLYDSVLSEEFFIGLDNNLEKIISLFARFADSLNGFPGVVSLIGTIFTKVFNDQIASSIDNAIYRLNSFLGINQETQRQTREEAVQLAQNINYDDGTEVGASTAASLKTQISLQNDLINSSANLSDSDKKRLQILLDINKAYGEQAVRLAQQVDQQREQIAEMQREMRLAAKRADPSGELRSQYTLQVQEMRKSIEEAVGLQDQLNKINNEFKNSSDIARYNNQLKELANNLRSIGQEANANILEGLVDQFSDTPDALTQGIESIINSNDILNDAVVSSSDELRNLGDGAIFTTSQTDNLANALLQLTLRQRESGAAMQAQEQHADEVRLAMQAMEVAADSLASNIVRFMQGVSQLSLGINSIISLTDTLNNSDLTFGEKMLTTFMSLSMAIPMLIEGFQALHAVKLTDIADSVKTIATKALETIAHKTNAVAIIEERAALLGLQMSLTPVLGGIIALTAAIVVLVAIAGGLVAIFNAIQAASPEGKLAAAQQEAENAAKAFEKISNSVNETKAALDGLDTSYDTIESLTEGTLEWYEAVSKVNAEILGLIEKYPELQNYVSAENGIFKLDEQGYNIANENMTKELVGGQINKIIADQKVAEAEINYALSNFNKNNNLDIQQFIPESSFSQEDIFNAMQQAYSKGYGDMLFTEEGIKAFQESLYPEYESSQALTDYLKEFADNNKENIEKINNLKKEISSYDQLLADTIVSSTGTIRSAENISNNMGLNINSMLEERVRQLQNDFKWKNRFDYSGNEQEIQDFLKAYGEDAKYIAQKSGEMIIEVSGEEMKISKEQFYNQLAGYYLGDEFKQKFTNILSSTLTAAAGDAKINLDELSSDQIISLDSFYQSLGGLENQPIFESIMGTVGSDMDDINNFLSSISYIDFSASSEQIRQLALSFNEGKLSAEQFRTELEKINAQAQLDTMGSFFTNAADSLGLEEEDAIAMQNYAKYIAKIAEESDELSDELAVNAEYAADFAVQVTKMNKGIEDLNETMEDWYSILKKSSKESEEYSSALDTVRTGLSKILDVQSDTLTDDFITKNLDDIKAAAQGSEDAIDRLRSQMDEEIILQIKMTQPEEVAAEIQALDDQIESLIKDVPDIELEARLNSSEFLAAANQLVSTAGMTADQANDYFAGIGYEPVYNEQEIDMSSQNPNSKTLTEVTDIGWNKANVDLGLFGTHTISLPNVTTRTVSIPEDPTAAKGSMNLVSFNGSGNPPEIRGFRKKATGSMNNYSSKNSGGPSLGGGKSKGGGGSGGGSSSPAKKQPYTAKTEIVDRYYEITNAIEDLTEALDDATKASDRLFGKDKLTAMEKEKKLIEEQIDLYKKKQIEILNNLHIDKMALINNEYKIPFKFDANNNIINYTEEFTKLYNELHQAEVKYNSLATAEAQSEYQESTIDPINEKIDQLKKLIETFEETRDQAIEVQNTIDDLNNQIQDYNYNKLTYELELKTNINEMVLEELEYYLDKMSDDFYSMAESMALMQAQSPEILDKLLNYKIAYGDLQELYETGKISQADYIEGLKDVRSNIYENLSALISLDKEMVHYYEDTLDKASEELSSFTDQLDQCTSILDHFKNMLGLIGRENDLDSLGKILEGQLKTTQNTLEVQKNNYKMLLKQKESLEEKLSNETLGEKEREMIEQEYKAITEAVLEAQEKVYETTEALGEIAGEILDNNLAKAQKALESLLTGGSSISEMLENLDRLSKSQEEYLTKTNQLYETNKLIRQAQQDMDSNDSALAKKKYQDYIKYVEQLEEQGKLSEYELTIAQAKYEILQAELALEEAKSSKDSMRLVRDASGNWDYVYTANQDKISEAEQALADAQNNLYNIGLEGAQDYQSKYAQTMQEAIETFNKINDNYKNGMYTSEQEYNNAMLEAQKYYYDLLQTYSDLYYLAHGTMIEESYQNEEDYIFAGIGNLEDFKDATNEYLGDCNNAFDDWKENTEEVTDIIGEDLDDTSDKVDQVVEHSEDLTDTIVNDVIPSIEDELWAVRELTDEWAAQRDEIYDTIAAYEKLARVIAQTITNESIPDKDWASEMAGVEYGSDEYNLYKKYRENKIEQSGNDYGVSNERLDTLLRKVSEGDADAIALRKKYKFFTDIPESDWLRVVGFATGGYTGDWGPSAKLGLLHEKELILNQNDTKNFLNGTMILREIADILNTPNFSDLLLKSVFTIPKNEEQHLIQDVSIQASFPSVTNHLEIEEALNNLINDAAQLINEKDRRYF